LVNALAAASMSFQVHSSVGGFMPALSNMVLL
jgi:hypothetical protein